MDSTQPLLPAQAPDTEKSENFTPQISCLARFQAMHSKVTAKLAVMTSAGWTLRVKKFSAAVLFTLDPLFKSLFIYKIITKDPIWTSIVIYSMLQPIFVMYVVMNFNKEAHASFTNSFRASPTLPIIFKLHFVMIGKSLRDASREYPISTTEEQVYVKLQLLSAGFFEQLVFMVLQVYIFWRQQALGRDVVDISGVLPAVLSSSANTFMAYDYLTTYSRICAERSMKRFLRILMSLGHGSAPPMLLSRLRTEETVVISREYGHDLQRLNGLGLSSIFLCIAESVTLRHCSFLDSGIEIFLNEYIVKTNCLGIWQRLMGSVATSRHLKTLTFKHQVDIPEDYWDLEHAVCLEIVQNGPTEFYNRSSQYPDSLLRKAVEQNNHATITTLMASGQAVSTNDLKLAIGLDHWHSLSVMLTKPPPALIANLDALAFCAARVGAPLSLQLLLHCKASPNSQNRDQTSLLMTACDWGHHHTALLLLEQRADIEHQDSRGSALSKAAKSDLPAAAEMLVAARANVNLTARNGFTPLGFCAECGAVEVASVLLRARADVHAVIGGNNYQAHHQAAAYGCAEMLRILVAARADANARVDDGKHYYAGMTPLQIAQKENEEECVLALIQMTS